MEWRKAGAVLTEDDKGLASASKRDQEDVVTEAFPSTREASGSEAEVILSLGSCARPYDFSASR